MKNPLRAAAPSSSPPLPGDPPRPELGPLAELPGTWIGKGFNLIALPVHKPNQIFRLLLNSTVEILSFAPIGAPIPNRGFKQGDIEFLGLHYLQQVSDSETNAALHLEPGLWLNMPATSVPDAPAGVVRQATIPHGNSVLAQGRGFTVDGGPQIAPVSSLPHRNDGQPLNIGYLEPYLHASPLPPGIRQEDVENPNAILTDAIQGQEIVRTTVLQISSKLNRADGILNIPFLVENANATRLDATFWIETVRGPGNTSFLQLQYTQTVILDFDGIAWPHISVATLVKQ